MREIRNLFRFIPFGKFSISGRGRPPFNQVYVGRQKERSNFIELLTHQEKFGAFLISGHRGAGKSSFVEYCLNEYERMAFQRSIRISRSSQLMSAINLTLIAVMLITVYVLLSQFLELAAQNTFEAILSEVFPNSPSSGFSNSTVLWMAVPLLIGSLAMLIPGYLVLQTASAIAETQDTSWQRKLTWSYFLILTFALPVGWIVAWQASWGIDIRYLLFGFVWVLIPLMTLSLLVQDICKSGRHYRSSVIRLNTAVVLTAIFAGLVAIVLKAFDEYQTSWPLALFSASDSGSTRLDPNLIDDRGIALIFYAAVHITACLAVKRVLGSRRTWLMAAIWLVACYYSVYYFLDFENLYSAPGEAATSVATQNARLIGLSPLALFFMVFGLYGLQRWLRGPLRGMDNVLPFAPIRTILILKANFFMLLTFLGVLPLVRVIAGTFLLRHVPETTGPDGRIQLHKSFQDVIDRIPHLGDTHIGIDAFLTIFVICILIYRCEYLWINRDLRSFRQDSALGLLGRARTQPNYPDAWPQTWRRGKARRLADLLLPRFVVYDPNDPAKKIAPKQSTQFQNVRGAHLNSPVSSDVRDETTSDTGQSGSQGAKGASTRDTIRQQALEAGKFGDSPFAARSRYVFRKLERATLPYWVYSVRHPVMKVWINLGFDNLEHSRIVEAMLRRLRGMYRRRFIGLTSVIGGMNALLIMTAAVLVTSLASKSIFHIGNISDFERDGAFVYRFEGNAVSSRDVFGATNYCGFFEVYPEVAPVSKSFVCALPFANGIMELLYAPILQIHTDFQSEVPVRQVAFGETRTDRLARLVECTHASPRSALYPPTIVAPDRPIAFFDWSNCLGPQDQQGILYEMFVGPLDAAVPSSPQSSLVGDSELVRLILDPNHGLPLVDFDTVSPPARLSDVVAPVAFSAHGPGLPGSPTLRFYHLLLYVLAFLAIFSLNRRLRVLPYQANIDAMDELILLINGRETLHSGEQNPRGWLGALWPFRKSERTVETSGDPRVVEQRFIELLDRMRPHQPSFRDGPANMFEVCPEITFVFDEMDKLSGIVDPELSKEAEGQTQLEENSRERARSLQLHQLLSDMKRLISGNSARFIFIGGRLYHDEWLADQAQRAPILNSIFSGQIYLPSLMADRNHTFGRMNDRITELVILMYRNARHRYYTWRGLRRAGAFMPSGGSEEPSYVQFDLPYSAHPRRLSALAHLVQMQVRDSDGKLYSIDRGTLQAAPEGKADASTRMGLGEQETLDQFINFLTYRSAGNPKKLKELIQSMVQTASHGIALPRYPHETQSAIRWTTLRSEAHDLITLNDAAIYRMQFIDMLYRHLTDHIEGRMLERDDKVSMSIFYLMDFLMKFHNRGFSRTNLQRVDELSHIHRAPDLRSVMSLLVQISSERFLHRVLNGVYNFRFRSDFAREIDYLSRISKEEMAALNFTLDESQSLKGLYQQTINTGERENIDTISGLGELYEYDQEYEIARNYYRRAVAMLDDVQTKSVLAKGVRHKATDADSTAGETDAGRSYAEFGMFGDMLAGQDVRGRRKIIETQVHWVVARLRLMLQIGQTYEQEQNFERANASYMHSARFSDLVLEALSQEQGDADDRYPDLTEDDLKGDFTKLFSTDRRVPLVVLRNLSIFYQAGFAAAWVLEKDPENIDDSVVYAESWVRRLYDREPLLRYPLARKADYSKSPPFSGNILIQGALAHDRLGDLYFLKGQQSMKSVPYGVIVRSMVGGPELLEPMKRTGYLGRAQYNYAMSLWLLRKYLTNRHRISGRSWAVPDDVAEPFERKSITSSQFHVTLSDALTDLAEVLLGQRSSLRLSRDLLLPPKSSDRKNYTGPLSLGDLHKYRRCLRALFNGSIERFNDNLIVPDRPRQTRAKHINWIHVSPDVGGEKLNVSGAKRTPKTEQDKMLELEWIEWSKKANAPVQRDILHERWGQIEPIFRNHMLGSALSCGNFSQWIGQRSVWRKTAAKGVQTPHMEGIQVSPPGREFERLMGYKFFSQAAARANQSIGQSTNSSHEYFLQADALNATLWDVRMLSYIRSLGEYEWPEVKGGEPKPQPPQAADAEASEPRKEGPRTPTLCKFVEQITKDRDLKQSDEELFHIGMLSLTSILDAVKRIQFSDRPSTTRMALNHGNPDLDNGLMQASGDDEKELRADYDMAQAFRDDPRGITQGCSLILALLHPGAGRLCVSVALLTYRDVLMKYAHDTFDPSSKEVAKNKVLAKALKEDEAFEIPKEGSVDLTNLRKALYEETYAGLRVSLERYRYPILNRLNGLKILADALILQDAEKPIDKEKGYASNHLLRRRDFAKTFGTERNSQIARCVRELAVTADVYGSDLHFPVDRAGQTMALTYLHMQHYGLHAIYDDMIADPPDFGKADEGEAQLARKKKIDEKTNAHMRRARFLRRDRIDAEDAPFRPLLNEMILTRESVGEMAVNRLSRSQESTSMGDAYYENVGYLNYLNDDFNDRSIHFYHATAMAHADFSEILSLFVKEGFYQN